MRKYLIVLVIVFSVLVLGLTILVSAAWAKSTESGLFVNTNQILGKGPSYAVALGDVDGDLDLDAFVAKNGPNEVWLNDGTAVFSNSQQQLGSDFTQGVALGDVDGDLDLDAFVANRSGSTGAPDRVWLSDGLGNFTIMTQTLGTYSSEKVVLLDMDMDDDLDAFVTACGNPVFNTDNTNALWLNDGSGQFVDSGSDFGQLCSVGVAVGDLNHDNKIDIVVGNAGPDSGVEVWLNVTDFPSGTLAFIQTQFINLTYNQDIAVGDLNNDTHLDIVIANSGGLGTNQPDHVFTNDGTGHFIDSGYLLGNGASSAVGLEDFNLDSYIDIVIGSGFPNEPVQVDTVWFNDASFSFTSETLGETHAQDIGVGDLDMDGDMDLFLALNDADQVWENWVNIVFDNVTYLPFIAQE